jgi:hypothetical protein
LTSLLRARLASGEYDGTRFARVQALYDACVAAGIDAGVGDTIDRVIWGEFAFLVALSAATSSMRQPLGPIRDNPRTRRLFRDLMSEVVAVAMAQWWRRRSWRASGLRHSAESDSARHSDAIRGGANLAQPSGSRRWIRDRIGPAQACIGISWRRRVASAAAMRAERCERREWSSSWLILSVD